MRFIWTTQLMPMRNHSSETLWEVFPCILTSASFPSTSLNIDLTSTARVSWRSILSSSIVSSQISTISGSSACSTWWSQNCQNTNKRNGPNYSGLHLGPCLPVFSLWLSGLSSSIILNIVLRITPWFTSGLGTSLPPPAKFTSSPLLSSTVCP